MAQKTGIEWTDESSNPLRYRSKAGKDVWACVKVSAGCAHCYAEAIAMRFERGGPFSKSKMEEVEPYVSDAEIGKLLRSQKLAGKKVFLCDMTDLFGEWVPDVLIDKVFAVMGARPDVTFQVLTKRAHWMKTYLTSPSRPAMIEAARVPLFKQLWRRGGAKVVKHAPWPLPNVWLGVSTENQDAADKRIPDLLKTPAAVRFLSVEPLLGPVQLDRCNLKDKGSYEKWSNVLDGTSWQRPGERNGEFDERPQIMWSDPTRAISWVIVGGESGQGSRLCNIGWIRSIVEQCKAAGVACFVKQVGARPMYERLAEECGTQEVYVTLNDRKGGDMDEWPEDLRVRQFPAQPEEAK